MASRPASVTVPSESETSRKRQAILESAVRVIFDAAQYPKHVMASADMPMVLHSKNARFIVLSNRQRKAQVGEPFNLICVAVPRWMLAAFRPSLAILLGGGERGVNSYKKAPQQFASSNRVALRAVIGGAKRAGHSNSICCMTGMILPLFSDVIGLLLARAVRRLDSLPSTRSPQAFERLVAARVGRRYDDVDSFSISNCVLRSVDRRQASCQIESE